MLRILESKLCIFFRSETSDAWCHQDQTASSCKTSLAEFETLHCTLGKEEILIAISLSHDSETDVLKNTLGVHFQMQHSCMNTLKVSSYVTAQLVA